MPFLHFCSLLHRRSVGTSAVPGRYANDCHCGRATTNVTNATTYFYSVSAYTLTPEEFQHFPLVFVQSKSRPETEAAHNRAMSMGTAAVVFGLVGFIIGIKVVLSSTKARRCPLTRLHQIT